MDAQQQNIQTKRYTLNKPEDANIEFIDLIQANWNAEKIVLAFIQINPGGASPEGLTEQLFDGRLVSQIAITWPHLVRIKELFDKMIRENKEAVIDATTTAFKNSDGGENNE